MIPVRVIANRIRRATTLSRHVLSELGTLGLPRMQAVLSESVSFGEISFSGMLPSGDVSRRDQSADIGASSGCRVFEKT